MSSLRRRYAAVLLAVSLSAVAACGSSPGGSSSSSSSEPPILSPLSGAVVRNLGQQVLVVKVENTHAARPQVGLSAADIVYVEQVEGGISRLAAVFSSNLPPRVGPIRSARITDPDLVAQFGHVAFAYSGAQAKMGPVLKAADMTLLREVRNKAWIRVKNRVMPHNLFGVPAKLLESANAKGTPIAKARNMGWVFDAQTPAGGKAVTRVVAPYPAESIAIDWKSGAWRLTSGRDVLVDGSKALRPATVIIQFVVQTASRFHGHNGSPTPYEATVGSGTALLLRDGRVWKIKWSRKTAKDATSYTAADGTPIAFAPGGMWVMLMDKQRSVKVAYAPVSVSASASQATSKPSP